jgi:hypothetical protein
MLFNLYTDYSSSWTKLAKHFRGRTENSIKNRFYSTLRKIKADLKKKGITAENIGEKVQVKEFMKQTSLYQMLLSRKDLIFKTKKRKLKKPETKYDYKPIKM